MSSGNLDVAGTNLNAGKLNYQNVGKKANLSFDGLQLKNSLPTGSTISLFTLNSDGRPLMTTKSVLACQNIALYLTITTDGEIILGNYSGITIPSAAIIEGQVSYVIG